MSNTNAHFSIINHTNQESVSSYALPFCRFQFVLDLDGIERDKLLSNRQVLWDYGDGTTSKSLTGSHAYSDPGEYQVHCYLYDSSGNAYLNTHVRSVIIKNFLVDMVSLSASNTSSYPLTAGRIESPVLVSRTNSYQSYGDGVMYSIIPHASGGDVSTDYFDKSSSTLYGHLDKYGSFYTSVQAKDGTQELVETKEIVTPSNMLYCKLDAGEVVFAHKGEEGSVFCGTSGAELVYYKDDVGANVPTNLYFGFKTGIFDGNTSTVGLQTVIEPNIQYDTISITSNGVDGEGTTLSAFDINSPKFKNQQISFVSKLKDPDNFSIKDVDIDYFDNTLLQQVTASGVPTFVELSSTFIVSTFEDGHIKGFVTPHSAADVAKIRTVATFSPPYTSQTTLTGYSTEFPIFGDRDIIYTTGNTTYSESTTPIVAKHGEDVDMLDHYKELRFQELFFDKVNLFDNFLGSIVGTLSSDQNSIGKKVHEKIANFVDNNSNIATCEVPQLISLLKSVEDENIEFEDTNFNYPVALKRLIDLLSIKHSKLFGTSNTFDLDFYNYGNSRLHAGKNLGNEIVSPLNYTLSAGTDIVALEKFSSTFKKLNSHTPLSSASLSGIAGTQYPLSTYSVDWGWYLILNDGFLPTDIAKYYTFFEFNQNSSPTVFESIINFTDPNTTMVRTMSSFTDWSRDNGYVDQMLSYQLYQGLNNLDINIVIPDNVYIDPNDIPYFSPLDGYYIQP